MHISIEFDNIFASQDDLHYKSLDGATKVKMRSENSNTLCIIEVNGELVIRNE